MYNPHSVILIPVNFNPNSETAEYDLLDTLDGIACERDEDFNGNNEDYLWECAEKEGYTSNASYVYDHIVAKIKAGMYDKYIENDDATEKYSHIIQDYLDEWLGSDDYYEGYTMCFNRAGSYTIAWTEERDFYAY